MLDISNLLKGSKCEKKEASPSNYSDLKFCNHSESNMTQTRDNGGSNLVAISSKGEVGVESRHRNL